MVEISVIMPIYNAEKSLNDSINSLLNQKFKKSYEIVLINDGSIDNSDIICEEYLKKYNNIKYRKTKNNGVSNARNVGIDMSDSKYIMFIDSDDTLEKDALDIMYNEMEKKDVDLVVSGYRGINTFNKKEKIKNMEIKTYKKINFDQFIERAQNNNLFNQLWNKIFKLEIIRENKIKFNAELSLGEDYRFVLEYVKYSKNIKCIDNIIYNYTYSINGLNTTYRKNRLDINLENFKLLEEFYHDNGYNMKYIHNKYLKIVLSGMKNILNNPNKNERKENLKQFINDESIFEKLKSVKSRKNWIIVDLILTKKYIIIYILAVLSNIYDIMYKKIKFGY